MLKKGMSLNNNGFWISSVMPRITTFIPDNERWLHEPQAAASLKSALAWATETPAFDSNTDAS
jgi:hypothetical protein